ncbi:MAG: hypothetical protein B1H09_00690 [Gemmatimonadaceae bacterium 4484_173]|nr:MAG: hypothetical protein B1H09_00690 [Gemmatimonadaceae bacterium 4484_173]RKZ04265.1 MAG: hypothetical protein DRQ21_03220 [Candidatus Fermentibacteria bacterium]
MGSKVLVRVLIVLLAVLLIFRINQRVEMYRIPREACRTQMYELSRANIDHMYMNEGSPAPTLDSLLAYGGFADTMAVCPSLRAAGFPDSMYHYDAKLALGTQFAISCPNHDRHGGVVGGLIEQDFPDSLFMEADWMETFSRIPFPQYAENKRMEVSRSALIRVSEEEASYLAGRYPSVLKPTEVENLEINVFELSDPLGGEYIFEIQEDTLLTFWEHPEARGRARGDSINVQTWKFIAYTTSDPETSRVEVKFQQPLQFPSRADGAVAGDNDNIAVVRMWELTELGYVKTELREVDLVNPPRWEMLTERIADSEVE